MARARCTPTSARDQRLLVEYKPFEPAFYHTDIADWGMALLLARAAGPQAQVLVDTGHHYLSQNIEQIVAWLLAEGMLGGFHFNDRRYADDDLTMGSIDPYQVFRIFHEIRFFEWETGARADIAYVIDQSHNLKGKIEAMIQTVAQAQALFAKAALVDCEALAAAQRAADLVRAESCLQDAFAYRRPAARFASGERSRACRPIRWTPFATAAISSGSPGSDPVGRLADGICVRLTVSALLLEMRRRSRSRSPASRALAGVSFDLAPAKSTRWSGENGAGKSTLISIITGAETARRGPR